MRNKNYAEKPLQVRLHNVQEDTLNKILNDSGLRHRHEFVEHKILDCLGDLMLSGHRMFGLIRTSQGGHQLTNDLLRKFFSNKSNWEFESFEIKEKDNKGPTYPKVAAVNA